MDGFKYLIVFQVRLYFSVLQKELRILLHFLSMYCWKNVLKVENPAI
jgi:hypothetical protein